MDRRGFLQTCLALAAAPAIVRADSLMRIVPRDTGIYFDGSVEWLETRPFYMGDPVTIYVVQKLGISAWYRPDGVVFDEAGKVTELRDSIGGPPLLLGEGGFGVVTVGPFRRPSELRLYDSGLRRGLTGTMLRCTLTPSGEITPVENAIGSSL